MEENNNVRFMRFKEIITKYTDSKISMTRKEIEDMLLEVYGIEFARGTFLSYIQSLQELGYNVKEEKINNTNYYSVLSAKLKYNDLKLLVDCICANKSISHVETVDILERLYQINSTYVGYSLERGTFVKNISKTENEEVSSNIDKIYEAIDDQRRIRFTYCQYDDNHNLVEKDKEYCGIPLELTISHEYYYLVMRGDTGKNRIYRVDKIKSVQSLEGEIEDIENIKKEYKESNYLRKCFKMYGGAEEISVTLKVNNEGVIGYIMDELGGNCSVQKVDGVTYVHFPAFMSDGLVKWILSIGKAVTVAQPEKLCEDVKKSIMDIAQLYQ